MTVSRPDNTSPIDVRGEVFFDGPSEQAVALKADGTRLHFSLPGWSALDGTSLRSFRGSRRALAATVGALKTLSLTMDVEVAGQRAIRLGEGVNSSLLARLLGLASTDIRLSTVVSLLRQRVARRYAIHR